MTDAPILVVDDSASSRKLVCLTLLAAGFRAHPVEDAETAWAALPELQPRLILLDLQLPGMDGLSFARLVRADPRYAELRIVALTGDSGHSDAQYALTQGCDGYLTKPIDTRDFAARVAAFLGPPAAFTDPT